MAKQSGRTAPSPWIWVVVALAAVAVLFLGYRGLSPRSPSAQSGSVPKISEPPLPSSGFTWQYQAYHLGSLKPAHLARGSRVTVVMLMASWCLYCAYEDKYVWPTILHTKGLVLDIIDVSTYSGIGDPGPKAPAFTGHDNPGPVVGAAGMNRTMENYIKQFHLQASNVHVYVDPQGLKYWSVSNFPTILLLNRRGQLASRVQGALTISRAQSAIRQVSNQG